jgi:hypothetical protein
MRGGLGVLFEESDERGVSNLGRVVEPDADQVGFAGGGDDFAVSAQSGDLAECEAAVGPVQRQVDSAPALVCNVAQGSSEFGR